MIKQLVHVILNSWNNDAFAELLRGHSVTLICETEGFEQTSYGESTFCSAVSSLRSTQEETDSRVVLYCMYARDRGFKAVRAKSPDKTFFLFYCTMQITCRGYQ